MRITRSTLRRLIAEESARLLREAAEEESTATNEAEGGKKGKGRDNNCLYITYGGRGVYYFVAKGGLDEREAVERGRDVTAELVGDEDVADPLSLYDWLQNHDQIEYVFDDESIGGFAEKHEFMEQLRGVGEEEGLFADDEFINEEDEALDETEDQHYNDDMQSRLGRFTSPENVKGTPQHKEKHRGPSEPSYSQVASRGSTLGGGYDYSEYDHLMREGGPGDDFLDYDPEEIPDMDDQYDPDYYEGLDDEGDDEDFMDYETGEDDVPYGAADVALRKGRGHRTDEGHDPLDSSDYEGSRHRRAYSDDPDDESGKVDRWGEPIPYLKHDSEATDLDADAEDEMAGEEEDWSWDGYDYEPDLKRTSHFAHTAQKYKETGNSDPGMDPDDHSFGRARGLDEARWAKLAGILKG